MDAACRRARVHGDRYPPDRCPFWCSPAPASGLNWFVGTRFRTRAVRLETQGGSACALRGVAYPLSRSGHGENSAQGLVVQSLSKTPRRGFSPAFAPLLPREDRHATSGAAVSWPSSCQRTRRDTQARVRPVANLLQLCGGSRRPWLWVGGYDRTAWVISTCAAAPRLSCVRPKASFREGVKRGRFSPDHAAISTIPLTVPRVSTAHSTTHTAGHHQTRRSCQLRRIISGGRAWRRTSRG